MHKGLILNKATEEHWKFGAATEHFGSDAVNATGNWTDWKAADEPQSIPGFDTNGCADFATLKAYISLAKFCGFDFPSDASERYTGAWAGTTADGTDPHEVAESIRTTAGLVPQATMPWTPDIHTLEAYYDKQMAARNLPVGKELLQEYEPGHEWVFAWGSGYTAKQKADLLRKALTRGTVCVSVYGNYQYQKGNLVKPKGTRDTHWVQLLRFDGNHGVFHDQYEPFIKSLAENYDHDAAKVYFLKKKTPVTRTIWTVIWQNFFKLWRGS